MGRRDFQVKVRGHRIELGEVEAALSGFPGVSGVVVTAVGDRSRRLVAVVAGAGVDPVLLGEFAAARLPGYMVPERVAVVDRLPLSGNGKVDRVAAAGLLAGVDPGPRVGDPPRGPVETVVARLFGELLELPQVGRDDNFFALGGDSLLATRLLEAARRALGADLTLRALLGAPTPAELGALVAKQAGDLESGLLEEGVI